VAELKPNMTEPVVTMLAATSIGTAEIYRQVETIREVMDSLVVGQDWDGDMRIVLFAKLGEGIELAEGLVTRIKTTIRQNCTPRHVRAKIIAVEDIPYTISGKKVELAVRKVIHGQEVKNRDALANPEALDLYIDLPDLKSWNSLLGFIVSAELDFWPLPCTGAPSQV